MFVRDPYFEITWPADIFCNCEIIGNRTSDSSYTKIISDLNHLNCVLYTRFIHTPGLTVLGRFNSALRLAHRKLEPPRTHKIHYISTYRIILLLMLRSVPMRFLNLPI
jgi:hypothetical protein